MPRVLFLLPTATYRAEAFLEAAQRLQLDVTVASESPAVIHDRTVASFLPISFRDTDQAVRSAAHFAATHPIDAVIGVEDQTTVVAAAISAALRLPHNSIASAAAAEAIFSATSSVRTFLSNSCALLIVDIEYG